ncbi:MAG: polyphosphate polymerase domain-containing protein [Ruminococcaceae bacterium]|nr:polyphosphate polymerase domain-containing protein [Oscillospiraceae bacterium]
MRLAKAKFTYTFRRYEKKYYITDEQAKALLKKIGDRIIPDEFGETVICNLYYDTPDFLLIRRSLDKPLYKEKLRLRCYSVPKNDSTAFIEIKKKFAKVVYKRRLDTTYERAINYLKTGDINLSGQIKNELDWFLKSYKSLAPSTAVFYTRRAFFDKTNPELRITIDKDIMWRRDDLDLSLGAYGERLIDENHRLLEIKIPGVMPMWLAHILSELNIFPNSFSKYGKAYLNFLKELSCFGGK